MTRSREAQPSAAAAPITPAVRARVGQPPPLAPRHSSFMLFAFCQRLIAHALIWIQTVLLRVTHPQQCLAEQFQRMVQTESRVITSGSS